MQSILRHPRLAQVLVGKVEEDLPVLLSHRVLALPDVEAEPAVQQLSGLRHLLGPKALLYLLISFFFSVGLHPLGARWIQEHYLVHPTPTQPQRARRSSVDSLEPSPGRETSGARIVRHAGIPHLLDETAASIPVRPERHSVFPPGAGIEGRHLIERALQARYRVSGNRSGFAAMTSVCAARVLPGCCLRKSNIHSGEETDKANHCQLQSNALSIKLSHQIEQLVELTHAEDGIDCRGL